MTGQNPGPVVGLVGVYRADGGPIGEIRYILGRMMGTAHCALCDVTHSPVRRKPAWDALVARLGLPVELLHLNEMPPEVAAAVGIHGAPVVLARMADGGLEPVLGPDELESLGGSVGAFGAALDQALARLRGHGTT